MRILGIETSCDDTAVCLAEASGSFGPDFRFSVLANATHSQAAQHAQYGGVFPNLAKNEHQKHIIPLIEEALAVCPLSPHGERAGVRGAPDIGCIAVTYGPGLEPSLWVGVNAARALAMQWNIPLVGVNHMEGHILASLLREIREDQICTSMWRSDLHGRNSGYMLQDVTFPLISLLVSGGHTELVLMRDLGDYEIIGQTRDDAAGEAFDKIARMLGTPYPGGPEISRLAAEARKYGDAISISGHSPTGKHGKSSAFSEASPSLPRPMLHSADYDFSFAGLKTAAKKLIEQHQPLSDEMRAAIAREAEDAIVDVLVSKTLRAAQESGASTILVGGGVSANAHLRHRLAEAAVPFGLPVYFPEKGLSTDNAVMIALAGYFHALKKEYADPKTLRADGKLSLS